MAFDLLTMTLRLPALAVALTFHEFAHAWVADRLGDPTPRRLGRLTLEPWAHLDPIGTLLIVFYGFGWAKPVPTNPYYYSGDPRKGLLKVAFAGPLANLALAFILAVLMVLDFRWNLLGAIPYLGRLIGVTFQLNVLLAVFNLMPLPPLDGYRVLAGLLPAHQAYRLERLEQVGPLLLLVVLVSGVATGLVVGLSRVVMGLLWALAEILGRVFPPF